MSEGKRSKNRIQLHTRLLSALLAAVMLLALLPVNAFAADGDKTDTETAQEISWEELQSYLKPFTNASEDMDCTFWGVLHVMEDYIASIENESGMAGTLSTAYDSEEAFMSQYMDRAYPNTEIEMQTVKNYAGSCFTGIQDGMDRTCTGVLTLMNTQVSTAKSNVPASPAGKTDTAYWNARNKLNSIRTARSKFIRDVCPKPVVAADEELAWNDIKSYLGEPFDRAQEKIKKTTYKEILKFMNDEIKTFARRGLMYERTVTEMVYKRDQFILKFMPVDTEANRQSWYPRLTIAKSWDSLSASERMAYLSEKYNAAADTYYRLLRRSGVTQECADASQEMTEWKARFLAFAPYDDTDTEIARPEWCLVSNDEWNKMTTNDARKYFNDAKDLEYEHSDRDDAVQIQWSSYLKNTFGNVSWSAQLKQRDMDIGLDMSNTYALTVTTGTNAGTNVKYFAVVYNSGGQEYTQFILPHEGDLDRSRKLIEAAGSGQTRSSQIMETYFGYKTQDVAKLEPLQPYKTDTYVFQPLHPFESLSRVQVYLSSPQGSTTWSCQSLRVYQVTRLYGTASYGYVSDQDYVRFDGTLLANTTTGFDLNANPSMQFTLPTSSWSDANSVQPEHQLATPSGDDAVVTADKESYIFRIDMADVWNGSIRGLATEVRDNKANVQNLHLPEAMLLSVRYEDTFGAMCDVKIPVITSALGYAIEKGIVNDSTSLAGVAQQGDTLAVEAMMPNLKTVREVKLSLGTQKAVSGAGLVETSANARRNERIDLIGSQSEVYLTGVSLYSADSVSLQMNAEGNAVAPEFNGDPIMCYTAQSSQGNGLTADADWVVPMQVYEGQRLAPEETADRYLVRLTTDDVENAGTTSNIHLDLKYKNKAGLDKSTGSFDVHQLVNEYYGYWPGSNGGIDYAYYYGAGQGHTLEFQISVENVDTFTGFTVGIGTGSDDWQLKKIEILHLDERSKRVIQWQNVTASNGETSDRMITRATVGTTVLSEEDTVLCQRGQDKTVTFRKNGEGTGSGTGGDGSGSGTGTGSGTGGDGSGSGTGTGSGGSGSGSGSGNVVTDADEDVVWRDSQYAVDYADACRDFGFAKERMTYTVKVNVASSVASASSSQTDDAGSKNLFYFQLVFGDSDGTSGTSGYVLANQQLNADGFRSGTEETFTIRTNRNYGELTAVNIIPDDTSGNSDIYDKLNIDSIKVIKNSTTALAKTWVINDVGWVGIDYKDDGAQTAINGQPARYASQLARSYLVDSSTYSVNLLFELTTDNYDQKGENNKDAADQQFQGSVGITLMYRDRSGVSKTVAYDMVDLMYQYAKRTPVEEKITSTGVTTNGNAQSDPTYMFRANKTDRFIIPVDGVSSLLSATLRVNGTVTTSWNIKGLSVSTFSDNGTLMLNSKGEYQRGGTSEFLCSDVMTAAGSSAESGLTTSRNYSVQSIFSTDKTTGTVYGIDQNLMISFASNTLNIDEQQEAVSCVSRLPQSSNDKVNVFVVPKDNDAPVDSLEGTLHYSLTGNVNQDMTNTFALSSYTDAATHEKMFYATGLTASNLKQLSSLALSNSSSDLERANIRISYAIVQVVRSNVVIGTYYYDFQDLNVYGGQSADPADTAYMNNKVQEVTLNFGENTTAATLSESKPNIAVALRYTVSYDPSSHVYYSPYVFLTDEEYKAIRAGQSATISFNEPFVKSIEGIMVVDVGDIHADYGPATAAIYTQNGDAKTVNSYYSLAPDSAVGSSGVRVFRTTEARSAANGTLAAATDKTVMNLRLTFTTPQTDDGGDPGTTTPVRATIYYTDYFGALRNRAIADLRKYIVSDTSGEIVSKDTITSLADNFVAGSTVTVNIPMTGVSDVERVVLEPYGSAAVNNGIKASWKPTSMRVVLGTNEAEASRIDTQVQINKRLFEGTPASIYVKNIQLNVEASYPGMDAVQTATTGGTIEGLIEPGQSVTIKSALTGTKDGYIVTAERRAEKDGAPTGASDCVTNDGKGNIVFTAPKRNDTGSIQYYTVKIAYAKDSDLAVTVQIHVNKSEPLPTEQPSAGGSTSGGTENTAAEGE